MKNKNFSIKLICLVVVLTLTGCGSSSGGGGGSGTPGSGGSGGGGIPYTVDCSAESAYVPADAPVRTNAGNGMADTSIILVHGKQGAPIYPHMVTLANDLAALNYDVIAPYMPWSGSTWDGTMCQGMLYISGLAQIEAANGRNVVVMGHSMGGAHTVMHEVIEPATAIDAYVTLAPGHFPHKSRRIRDTAAPGITQAETMVANGMGNDFALFDILSEGAVYEISATAYAFLSFHHLDQYPDVDRALPVLTRPVLWLSGASDPLTTNQNHATQAGKIGSAGSDYSVLSGDHYTFLLNVPGETQSWLTGLGF